MANITIAGASYTDVPAIIIPKTEVGNATFYDMDRELMWLGPETEHISKVYSEEYVLEDTLYNGWTPSTTAKAIIASKSLLNKPVVDMAGHEYYLRWLVDISVAHNAGSTLKATVERYAGSLWQSIHRRPYGFANFEAENYAYNYCTAMSSSTSYTIYYKTDGTRTWTTGLSYGFYPALTAASFSSTSSNSPTLTIKTPAINARCSATYFATARATEVDQANTTIKIVCDMYVSKIGNSFLRHAYGDAIKVLNTPLVIE